jgi:hypothetical protein
VRPEAIWGETLERIDAIDELDKRLDQATALICLIGSQDFSSLAGEIQENYASALAGTIDQAKQTIKFL